MNALYPTNLEAYASILFVFLRLMGLFLLIPGFSHSAIPANVKLFLALTLSLAFHPLVKEFLPAVPTSFEGIALMAARETFVGFLMGFAGYMTFEAINLAAQFIGFQMGFGVGGLMDPQNHAQVSTLVPLHGWLALMVFFWLNMHYQVLEIFIMSFKITSRIDVSLIPSRELLNTLISVSGKLFFIAIQMAAPVTLLVLACNLAVGVLSRLMPQLNVILFSFPVTILLGLCALYLLAPELLDYLDNRVGDMSQDILTVLKTL